MDVVLQVTWRRCYNVSGTSCKLLEEDVTTYQGYLKIFQRIRNVLQITYRRCYNVPTPPVTDHERTLQCLCLQNSKKNDEAAVPVCAQEHERYYPTPPHPTPPVTDHERAVQCLCLQDSKKDDEVAVPDPMSQPRVPKCYLKGMILWCSKWS